MCDRLSRQLRGENGRQGKSNINPESIYKSRTSSLKAHAVESYE